MLTTVVSDSLKLMISMKTSMLCHYVLKRRLIFRKCLPEGNLSQTEGSTFPLFIVAISTSVARIFFYFTYLFLEGKGGKKRKETLMYKGHIDRELSW